MSHRRDKKDAIKAARERYRKEVPRCRYDLLAMRIGDLMGRAGRGMNRKVYGKGGWRRNTIRAVGTWLVTRGYKLHQWRYYSKPRLL